MPTSWQIPKLAKELLMNKWLVLTILWYTVGIGAVVLAPLVDVHFGQRTIAVADPNRRTLTIIGGVGELWICGNHSDEKVNGRTCKSGVDVLSWIMREGEEK